MFETQRSLHTKAVRQTGQISPSYGHPRSARLPPTVRLGAAGSSLHCKGMRLSLGPGHDLVLEDQTHPDPMEVELCIDILECVSLNPLRLGCIYIK